MSDYWVLTTAGSDITQLIGKLLVTPGIAEQPGGLSMVTSPAGGTQITTIPDGTLTGGSSCYVMGPSVSGNNYWDFVSYGGQTGYVPDYWFYTGTDITEQIEQCESLSARARPCPPAAQGGHGAGWANAGRRTPGAVPGTRPPRVLGT